MIGSIVDSSTLWYGDLYMNWSTKSVVKITWWFQCRLLKFGSWELDTSGSTKCDYKTRGFNVDWSHPDPSVGLIIAGARESCAGHIFAHRLSFSNAHFALDHHPYTPCLGLLGEHWVGVTVQDLGFAFGFDKNKLCLAMGIVDRFAPNLQHLDCSGVWWIGSIFPPQNIWIFRGEKPFLKGCKRIYLYQVRWEYSRINVKIVYRFLRNLASVFFSSQKFVFLEKVGGKIHFLGKVHVSINKQYALLNLGWWRE